MSSPESLPEPTAEARFDERHESAVETELSGLLRTDEGQRAEWLDRRQPSSGSCVNWYLFLFLAIDGQLVNRPAERADWARLKLWLLRQGWARGMFTDAECAMKLAYFVAGFRRVAPDLVDLPSADEIVSACLDAMPAGPDRIHTLNGSRDLYALDVAQLRQSRLAKNLINAAHWYLDEIQDERLAGQLRQWIAVKPRLV